MIRKAFEELNLIDNFLFGVTLDHEEYGPLVAETILETILERKIKIKKINSEKPILPPKPGLRGVRLDAYIEEESADVNPGDIFDLEPDKKEKDKDILPVRTRFYHSRIDGHLLNSMQSFKALPNVWVIFITSFDPFGENRIVYTIKNHCVELPEMNYNDGAVTLFLYVNGEEGNASKKLRELLRYLANTSHENACNPELAALQACIDDIKTDARIKEAYMDLDEYIEREVDEAVDEATEELKAERDAAITERDAAVNERDAAVNERDAAVNERDAAVNERDAAVNERNAMLKKMNEMSAQLDSLRKDLAFYKN